MRRGEDPREWLEKSVSDCEEVLRVNPNQPEVYCHRAVTNAALGDFARSRREDPSPWYRKALADCKEALKRDPDMVLAHYYGAIAHRKLAQAAPAMGKDGREDFRRAIEGFKNVLKRTQQATMYCELGVTYVHYGGALKARMEDPRGSWRKAVEACTEALRRNPEVVSAYFNRAKALEGIGRVEFAQGSDPESAFRKAIEDYRQILRRRPRVRAVHNDLGVLYHALGDAVAAKGADPRDAFREGIEILEKALQRFPSVWEIPVNLASLLERVGRHSEAVRMYEEALRRGAKRSSDLAFSLGRARKNASKPAWMQDLEWAGSLLSWGDLQGARKRLEKGLKAAEKKGAYEGAEFRSILARGHRGLAAVLAASRAGADADEERDRLAAEAVGNLRKALELGFTDLDPIRKDPGLAPLRELPEFKALLKEWEEKLKKE
jgi:tetratricopeptide (TPR) repeat protein